MVKTIEIDEARRDNLERLSVEVESRKELMAFMIQNNMDTDGEQFKKYQKEYQEFYKEYDLAKNELQKNVFFKEFGQENVSGWSVDFASCTAEVTLK